MEAEKAQPRFFHLYSTGMNLLNSQCTGCSTSAFNYSQLNGTSRSAFDTSPQFPPTRGVDFLFWQPNESKQQTYNIDDLHERQSEA